MCQFRYYYYAGCQHQEIVLYYFCDNALRTRRTSLHRPPANIISSRSVEGSDDGHVGRSDKVDASESGSSSATTSSSSQSGSLPTSFTSFQESSQDASSLQHLHHSSHPPYCLPAPANHRRSSLPRLKVYRRQRVFVPASQPSSSTFDLGHEDLIHMAGGSMEESRYRSHSVPLDHVASARWVSRHTGPTDAPAQTDASSLSEEYECIEADINSLKEEVRQLRELDRVSLSSRHHPVAKHQSPQHCSSDSQVQESAATRLQRTHEADEAALQRETMDTALITLSPRICAPPSSSDFPELSGSSSKRLSKLMIPERYEPKPTYAHMATKSPSSVAEHATTTVSQSSTDEFSADSLVLVTPKSSSSSWNVTSPSEWTTAGAHTTLLSNQTSSLSEHVPAKLVDVKSSITEDGKIDDMDAILRSRQQARNAPHFAQPTKSFSRRKDETVKKSPTSPKPRAFGDSSPTRSLQTTENISFKRKCIPRDWIGGSAPPSSQKQVVPTTSPTTTKSKKRRVYTAIKGNDVEKTQDKHEIGNGSREICAAGRQAVVSYMAPTKATVQREKETLSPIHAGHMAQRRPPDTTPPNKSSIRDKLSKFPDFEAESGAADSVDTSLTDIVVDLPSGHSFLSQAYWKERTGDEPRLDRHIKSSSVCNDDSTGTTHGYSGKIGLLQQNAIPTITPTPAKETFGDNFTRFSDVVVTRRGSLGHLLQPICARLDKHGLLNPLSNTKDRPEIETRRAGHRSDTPRINENATTSTDQEPAQAMPSPRRTRAKTICAPLEHGISSILGEHDTQHSGDNMTGSKVHGFSDKDRKRSRTTTLRAIAQEFVPESLQDVIRSHNALTTALKSRTTLPPRDNEITVHTNAELPIEGAFCKGYPDDNTPADGLQHTLNDKSNSYQYSEDIYNPENEFACNTNAPIFTPTYKPYVQGLAASTMVPQPTIEYSNGKWTVQDVEGNHHAAHFGRGPSPPDPMSTASPEHRSNQVSGRASVPWTINRHPHHWIGGDGREIRFIDYNSPPPQHMHRKFHHVREEQIFRNGGVRYGGAHLSHFLTGPRRKGSPVAGSDSYDSLSPPPAPRSMRQWAERMRSPLAPCGDIQLTHAVEMIPASLGTLQPQGPWFGLCTACAGGA